MKTTLISLASLFIFILAISINSPASAKTAVVEDIVIVDDTGHVCKADAKTCNHSSHKANCSTMSKKDCKTKCASSGTKCSKSQVKSCCGSKGKKK